jgi:threonylcarbamoyladenosine tRNA methylthiotransferase MtaB
MASFSVRFLGCKVSQTDAQALRERLLRDGHSEVAVAGDVAVVNTCCVTNEGLAKSRHDLRHAPPAPRPCLRHRVWGEALEGRLRRCPRTSPSSQARSSRRSRRSPAMSARSAACRRTRPDRVRAFVKIQDGCSFSRAFCVIPLVRGATRSCSADAVLGETAYASPRAVKSSSRVSTSAASATAPPG